MTRTALLFSIAFALWAIAWSMVDVGQALKIIASPPIASACR